MKTAAIIVAAGSSRRMGFNKLLAPLAGEPVVMRTVRAFQDCLDIDEIIVVGGAEVAEVLSQASLSKLRAIVPGGAERHLSVWAGLEALSADVDVVAVHDGGRPLILPSQIAACVAGAREFGAVTCARRITETMKRCDSSGVIVGSIEREGAWIMETPQVFRHALLRSAYERVISDRVLVTDEVSALQHLGEAVRVIENALANPKITFPGDLAMAENLMAIRATPGAQEGVN